MPEERSIPVSALHAWLKGLRFVSPQTMLTVDQLEEAVRSLDQLCNGPDFAGLAGGRSLNPTAPVRTQP